MRSALSERTSTVWTRLEHGLWLDVPVADEALRLLTKAGGGKTAAMTPPPLMETDDDLVFKWISASGRFRGMSYI